MRTKSVSGSTEHGDQHVSFTVKKEGNATRSIKSLRGNQCNPKYSFMGVSPVEYT